ncbi:MAG TPA: SPFH domain-containing protein [Chloroflexia bacterium]|nr:SPFH domain-containing protein [Chloroflexia bacterium]
MNNFLVNNGALIIIAVVVFLLVVIVVSAIRVVPDFQRMVVFRLGRCIGDKGPGIVLLLPVLDKGVRVDLRETVFEVPPQTCITEDNATVSIDFLIYMKVVDAVPSVLQVVDFTAAARGIAITTLRAIVGDMFLDDVLAKRDHINETLRSKLDDATTRWGIKVTAVEIKEVIPPRDILESMGKQMSAERTRRALVLEADGQREAAIKKAEGQKQASILQAEGQRQATILQAEASRQAAVLQAEGYAMALDRVFQVARQVDARTMNLQYLETLKALGQSPSTKWVMPLELTNLVQPFTAIAQRVGQIPAASSNGNGNSGPLVAPAAPPASNVQGHFPPQNPPRPGA